MSGLMDLFGDESGNYSDLANKLRALKGNYAPWADAGKQSLSDLLAQYQKLTQNPTFLQDSIAKNYQMSPYATNQASWLKNQLNDNAAATGDLGGSYAAQTMGSNLQDLISKDESNYVNTGINSYNRGLAGEEGINQEGFAAENAMTGLDSQAAQAEMQGANSSQDAMNNLFGNILSIGSNIATGGAGGFSTLMGGFGKSFLPASWLAHFKNTDLLDSVNTLRKAGLIPDSGQSTGQAPGQGQQGGGWQGFPYPYPNNNGDAPNYG